MFTYKIDGITYSSEDRISILEGARLTGMDIPTLCYMEGIKPGEHCKLCLCEVKGKEELVYSCSTFIEQDMEIITISNRVRTARRHRLEEILSHHNCHCTDCAKNGNCELQTYTLQFKADAFAIQGEILREIDDSNPFYIFDASKCIGCNRCVNVCEYIQGNHILGNYECDDVAFIQPLKTEKRGESECVSCGNCVQVCPTGALIPKKGRYATGYDPAIETVCPYCGVGCKINVQVSKYNQITGITGSEKGVNGGLLCVKGRFAYDFISHPDRLKTPMLRKGKDLVPCSWEEAYDAIVTAFQKAKLAGENTIAGLASARCTNEDNYVFQKWIRIGGKTNNIDHCARLCHASTVAGLANSFGSGAMTGSIDHILLSDVIFVTGSNTTQTHPVIGSKILEAVSKGTKLIVAEPREIELCDYADLYLPIKPGSNVALLNAMIKVILEEGLEDTSFIQSFTQGYDAFFSVIQEVDVEEYAEICGVSAQLIREAARLYAKANLASIYYAMGVTQHSTGTQGVMSIANLSMLCGHIGKAGNGVHPLRGQNNVQGSCDMGALPSDLPGYQKVANPEILEKFSKAWKTDLSKEAGLTSTEIVDGLFDGKIQFLYIMGENPLVSDPNLNHTIAAFQKAEFIVVQDIFLTETTQYAHVVLPSYVYAEKDGTFTNTDRRVQRIRKAVIPPEGTKGDWQIICEIANLLGLPGFSYKSSEEIMKEIASLTPIYGGISYDRLETEVLQWPCPFENHKGTKVLHQNGAFTKGKGSFIPVRYQESAEIADEKYPLTLTTGRVLYQYHTRTMTGKNQGIQEISGECFIEVNEKTAKRYGITHENIVIVESPRGSITAKAKVTNRIIDNVIFIPFHYGENAVNFLTACNMDPYAKIPELKVSKARVKPYDSDAQE